MKKEKSKKNVDGKFMLMEIFFFCTVCMENGNCGGGNESFSFLMLLDINDVDGKIRKKLYKKEKKIKGEKIC